MVPAGIKFVDVLLGDTVKVSVEQIGVGKIFPITIAWLTFTTKLNVVTQVPLVAVIKYVAIASTGGPDIFVKIWLIDVTGVSWEVAPEIVEVGDIIGVGQV